MGEMWKQFEVHSCSSPFPLPARQERYVRWKQRLSSSLQVRAELVEHVNKPHGGDLLKVDSNTPLVPAQSQAVTFSYKQSKGWSSFKSHAQPFYPHLFIRCYWEKYSRDLASQVFERPLEQITGILLPVHWDRPGEGRRGQAGEQGSAWDKKTRPAWAPLYRSVSLAPRTGSPESMNGSLDGTSETLSQHRNFSLFFFVTPHHPAHATHTPKPHFLVLLMWACPNKRSHKTTASKIK